MSNTLRHEKLGDGEGFVGKKWPRIVALLTGELAPELQPLPTPVIDLAEVRVDAQQTYFDAMNEAALRTDTTFADATVHTYYYTPVGSFHVV